MGTIGILSDWAMQGFLVIDHSISNREKIIST